MIIVVPCKGGYRGGKKKQWERCRPYPVAGYSRIGRLFAVGLECLSDLVRGRRSSSLHGLLRHVNIAPCGHGRRVI